MRRKLFFAIFLISLTTGIYAQYSPDVLGEGFLQRKIQMPDDYEGKVVCTLIKKTLPTNAQQAVLYVHGYNDYFFQRQLGDSINAHGYNFYALDLRKYGRSILPHQDPFFCKSLTEYFADIDTALTIIRSEGNDRILLMAHSTGGLITPLYLKSKANSLPVDGLILNSPFLDWNFSWFMKKIVIPTVAFIGKLFPNLTVQGYGIASYANSLLKQEMGEWEYDTRWKMTNGHPKKAGWISAIQMGQREVRKGLKLNCPILVMSSDKSSVETKEWKDEYLMSDIVLNVHDIQRYAPRLGDFVTRDTIEGGIHDLILSRESARDHTYRTIFGWMTERGL